MNEQILNMIEDTRTILKNKYGKMAEAQNRTSMYLVFITVQRLGDKAPIKKIAQLKRFIDNNAQWLQL